MVCWPGPAHADPIESAENLSLDIGMEVPQKGLEVLLPLTECRCPGAAEPDQAGAEGSEDQAGNAHQTG